MTTKQLWNHMTAASAVLIGISCANAALAKDSSCIDYFTVGESKCQSTASTPVQRPVATRAPQLLPPSAASQSASAVDDYLANYGKPPREFVEFYLNPTAENAQKWVSTYQGMLQKGQDLSKAWGEAEQLYKTGAITPTITNRPQVQPSAPQVVVAPSPVVQQGVPIAPVGIPVTSIGAFSQASSAPMANGVSVPDTTIELTYYFSQVCPYCARMTPELAILSNEKVGKLAFTCVDVTPLTPQSRPEEGFITSKLPCKWRLPEAGEVDANSVRQTPTLIIQKKGQPSMRLSGYVPLAQLRQYF